MKSCLLSIVLLSVVVFRPAAADVLVLVHGYLGTANSWFEAGAMDRLARRGYRFQGALTFAPGSVVLRPAGGDSDKPVYTVNLPSHAPVMIQADWLAAMLRRVAQKHPGEPIQVAAHSAGGVVARMTLVRHGKLGVDHLITIAAPHFGTARAIQALQATDNSGMFGPIKGWFVRRATGDALYATVQQSRGVLIDLAPPAPGNMLFWLNQQPHPDIRYTAIMRVGSVTMPGDHVVPPMSQDLSRVPALSGRVKTYAMAQGHLLTAQDGDLIGNLLAMSRKAPESSQ